MCSLSAGALCREAFKTRELSTLSKGNGGQGGEGHKAGLIQRQPHSANTGGLKVGLEDLCSPQMFLLLHDVSSSDTYSFGLNSC